MGSLGQMRRAAIIGSGHYVPDKVVTNDELAKIINSSDEWIQQRTGIQERRFVEEGVGASHLGTEAAKKAVADAGLTLGDIDFIIFATLSPDLTFPGSGVLMQDQLGLAESGIGALDVRNQCTGFLYSLATADAFVKTGMYDRILVVGSETHSAGLEMAERGRTVTAIFGDGAAAVVVAPSEDPERGILSTHLYSDGRFAKDLMVECPSCNYQPRMQHEMIEDGRIWPHMNGKRIFREALTKLPEVITEAVEANGLTLDDVDLFIFHQANLRINEAVTANMGLREDRVFNNIQKYGNTTAASMPLVLDEARKAGKVKDGDLILFAALGSGLTWGSALVRW